MMIQRGKPALLRKDKRGWLPIHVACSRHVSIQKLQLLLDAFPFSVLETTSEGKNVVDLAKESATSKHPNVQLVDRLKSAMQNAWSLKQSSSAAVLSSTSEDVPMPSSAESPGTQSMRKVMHRSNDHAQKRMKPSSTLDQIVVPKREEVVLKSTENPATNICLTSPLSTQSTIQEESDTATVQVKNNTDRELEELNRIFVI